MKIDKVGATMRGSPEQWLNELLEKYPLKNLNHQVHLLKGEPEKLIPELAKEKRIEVIVMGTVCRTGVERISHWEHGRKDPSPGGLLRSDSQAGRVCDTHKTGSRTADTCGLKKRRLDSDTLVRTS